MKIQLLRLGHFETVVPEGWFLFSRQAINDEQGASIIICDEELLGKNSPKSEAKA